MVSTSDDSSDIRNSLKKNSVFASFSDQELDQFIPHIQKKNFQANEWIFKEEEDGNYLVLIVKGKVTILKKDPESKKDIPIKEFGENEIVGEMAFLLEESRSASVRALVPTSVLIITINQIKPDLLSKLKTYCLKHTTQRLASTSLKYASALSKLAHLLLIFALLIFFSILTDFFISGYLPDREAERVVEQLYERDKNGVIIGTETIEDFSGQSTLVFFVHGFMESPDTFKNVIAGLKAKNLPVDYYAPLAPFHSRNLQEMSKFNVNQLLQFLRSEIETYANKYKKVILVGYSMGGASLIALDKSNLLPENSSLILYAPGVYIKDNTLSKRIELHFFRFWRNYCNYKIVGCSYPVYASGDEEARQKIEEEQNLRYRVANAALHLYKLDLMSRDHLSQIKHPYALIIAEDDNRVSFEMQRRACEEDAPYCQPYYFSSGRHIIHWGKNKEQFIDLLATLIEKFEAKNEP